ncbi:MAG: hypothetical protein RSB64_16775, partial [Pseudomonas sp.]
CGATALAARFVDPVKKYQEHRESCGSWLASDKAISPDKYVACCTAIAGKPAPTVDCTVTEIAFINLRAFAPRPLALSLISS